MAARATMGFAAGALRQTAAAQARAAPQMMPRTLGQQTRAMGTLNVTPRMLPQHVQLCAWCEEFFFSFSRSPSPPQAPPPQLYPASLGSFFHRVASCVELARGVVPDGYEATPGASYSPSLGGGAGVRNSQENKCAR